MNNISRIGEIWKRVWSEGSYAICLIFNDIRHQNAYQYIVLDDDWSAEISKIRHVSEAELFEAELQDHYNFEKIWFKLL